MKPHEFIEQIENMGLKQVDIAKIKRLFSKVRLYPNNKKNIDLPAVYKDVFLLTGIGIDDIRSRKRTMDIVSARLLFVRRVLLLNPGYNMNMLADFLNKDRSSIYHYAYESKEKCDIPPLKLFIRNINMVHNNPIHKRYGKVDIHGRNEAGIKKTAA